VKPVLNGTWTEQQPVFSGKLLVPRILCKKRYETSCQWKLSNAEMENREKT